MRKDISEELMRENISYYIKYRRINIETNIKSIIVRISLTFEDVSS